jgi:hypothetical protein
LRGTRVQAAHSNSGNVDIVWYSALLLVGEWGWVCLLNIIGVTGVYNVPRFLNMDSVVAGCLHTVGIDGA